jgi:predicted transcriptional regulator
VTDAHELGPLEIRALEQFVAGQARSVADIQHRLAQAGHELAYTTVMTVLGRLHACCRAFISACSVWRVWRR